MHTICGLWTGGFILRMTYSIPVALIECPPTVYAAYEITFQKKQIINTQKERTGQNTIRSTHFDLN